MAARINKRHSEEIRQKIQASVILDRFHKHFMGKLELTPTQVKVGETLLDRSVPKLSQIQHTGGDGGPLKVEVIKFADSPASR
jgi:hypothetical protein